MPGCEAGGAGADHAGSAAVVEYARRRHSAGAGRRSAARCLRRCGRRRRCRGSTPTRACGRAMSSGGRSPCRSRRAQPADVHRPAGRHDAAMAARRQRTRLSPHSRSITAGGGANALVIAAIDHQSPAGASTLRQACAAISCSSLALGRRRSAKSKGPVEGHGSALPLPERRRFQTETASPRAANREGRVPGGLASRMRPLKSIASRLRRISSSAARSDRRTSGSWAHRALVRQAHHWVGGNPSVLTTFVLSLSKDGRTRIDVIRQARDRVGGLGRTRPRAPS